MDVTEHLKIWKGWGISSEGLCCENTSLLSIGLLFSDHIFEVKDVQYTYNSALKGYFLSFYCNPF